MEGASAPLTAPFDPVPGFKAERLSGESVSRLTQAAVLLRKAERPVRVLRAVAWGPEISQRFFAAGETELPQVVYPKMSAAPVHEVLAAARALIDGDGPVQAWLRRIADVIAISADMLQALGTKEFHRLSVQLYGSPETDLLECDVTPLDLAQMLDQVLSSFANVELNLNAAGEIKTTAVELGVRMDAILKRHFGDAAPKIEIVDHLSANALAGARYIRLRRDAVFSDRDLAQLVQHEAFVHIATSLNGAAQNAFPILGAGHAGTTRTQEGLAVFAEIISGAMDPSRLLRLADRALAIKMAMDGADFIQLYRYFCERTKDKGAAFENARRVVRGGMVEGGAPFTKDGVYLEGLVRVHNFLRIAVQETRVDTIRLLFAGKIDIEDMPAITTLVANGLCVFPKFMPPWAKDLRFMLSYIAYSAFLNRMNLEKVRVHYKNMLSRCAAPAAERAEPSPPVPDHGSAVDGTASPAEDAT